MRLTPRFRRRWQFSVSILAPAVISMVLTALAVLGFVAWSTNGIDRTALERETRLVAAAFERQVEQIPYAQESVAIWDDALIYTRDAYDKEWLDNNLGVWMYDYYGFDAVAVLDETNAPIYTMTGGVAPSPGLFSAERATIAPLVAEIRSAVAAGALDAYAAGTAATYPRALDLKLIEGRPAVVSIVPITSQTGSILQRRGAEYLHLAIDYLDADFAKTMADGYLLDAAGFDMSPARNPDTATYPVLNRGGRLVTFFEWQPQRPGIQLLNQTGAVVAAAFVITTVLVIALVHRIWVSSSALEAERLAAKHQAAHDPLTGLPNRTEFDRRLSASLAGRHRTPVALLMLDLDRFKQVNDTLGHQAGDDLIRAVGQRLKELIGPADVLARLGGDEFAIVCTGIESQEEALRTGEAFVDAIAKPFVVSGNEAFVGASIGVAIAGTDDDDPRELARKADIALYEAKAAGRNRVMAYADAMNDLLQDRHSIEADLREALKRGGQLFVVFQPLFRRDGNMVGSEALVRWRHPRLGQISPARFIPVAELTGIIEELGDFVLRRACLFGARWPGRRVAVNISPAQLRNPRFPEKVLDLLIETAMRPSDLELEITESILLDDAGIAAEALATLRRAGIRIALDDFGTGYSSLNYLKRYPVDRIKIDRSFVAQLDRNETSTAIVNAMVTLAHALDIEVTAEGVETNEQLAILTEMGCNLFQGYLLGPPRPEAELEEELRASGERSAPLVA